MECKFIHQTKIAISWNVFNGSTSCMQTMIVNHGNKTKNIFKKNKSLPVIWSELILIAFYQGVSNSNYLMWKLTRSQKDISLGLVSYFANKTAQFFLN